MAEIGQLVGGKYKLMRLINRGGMSAVYLAEDKNLLKKWVVKEIPKYVHGKENFLAVKSAILEAQIIKSLDHPSIVRIVDIIKDSKAVYIVEDHVEGISLEEFVKDGISKSAAVKIGIQLCRAVSYLHSQDPPVIYRDLKPENIIISRDIQVKLIDFGAARRYKAEKKRDTVYLGTERFAAPEQYEEYGAQSDKRTDIYGFGATFRYMLRFCDEKDKKLNEIIDKCTQRDPADRFQDFKELIIALENTKQLNKGYKNTIKIQAVRSRKGVFIKAGLGAAALIVSAVTLTGIKGGDAVEKDNLSEMKEENSTEEEADKLMMLPEADEQDHDQEIETWLAEFDDAKEYSKGMALSLEEDPAAGSMEDLFARICLLMDSESFSYLSKENRAEFHQWSLEILEAYSRKFKNDDVKRRDVQNLFIKIYSDICILDTEDESDYKLTLAEQLKNTRQAILKAYG